MYPEQLLIVYQLDSPQKIISLSARTASPLGPTPFDGCCQSLFQLRNVLMFHIVASVSSETTISAQKIFIFMQWRSSSVHSLPTDDLWSSLLRNFTCWYCPKTFVIFAVTLFLRLAWSLYLIFFTCFCRKPPRYVPCKGTYVPYDGTYGTPDQGQTLDVREGQTTESALRDDWIWNIPHHTLEVVLEVLLEHMCAGLRP